MNGDKILFYFTFSSPFGSLTIVWRDMNPQIKLHRIFLSDSGANSEEKAFREFNNFLQRGEPTLIASIIEKIQRFLTGKDESFDLELLDLNNCYEIQKKVLLAEFQIPRGWISTYKRIAIKIGVLNGARVVGNALARNPFPIVIPCHRAIKTNGQLGGFQGGIKMKRALLEFEGIKLSENGKVTTNNIYY